MAQQEKVDHLERKMEARHIQMISLGGVIGTGLFLSSGYTISQAGPIGTIIAYFFGAILVYAVMLYLGIESNQVNLIKSNPITSLTRLTRFAKI